MKYTFKILRFDPSRDRAPYHCDYEVEAQPKDRILDCLNKIRWEQDPTLAFRWSCGHGVCGSDALKINGICTLACQKLMRDYERSNFLVEPIPTFPVLKDLVVNMEPFFRVYRSLRPYLINPTEPPAVERIQMPEERKLVEDVIKCISCACCTSSCPVVTSQNRNYVGPAALMKAHRYIYDSRDAATIERLRSLDSKVGVWGCKTYFKCTEVCPRSIKVTKAINQIKGKIRNKSDK